MVLTLHSQTGNKPREQAKKLAKVAQLVEHDLAKVGVAGPSPVFRSKEFFYVLFRFQTNRTFAKVAQLVEHDLAKVGVAGPSPVFRSKQA